MFYKTKEMHKLGVGGGSFTPLRPTPPCPLTSYQMVSPQRQSWKQEISAILTPRRGSPSISMPDKDAPSPPPQPSINMTTTQRLTQEAFMKTKSCRNTCQPARGQRMSEWPQKLTVIQLRKVVGQLYADGRDEENYHVSFCREDVKSATFKQNNQSAATFWNSPVTRKSLEKITWRLLWENLKGTNSSSPTFSHGWEPVIHNGK